MTTTLYQLLAEDLPKEAIQFADKEKTKKGFDMTGYSYQYVVNRLNEVLGINGWGTTQTAEVIEGKTAKGYRMFEAVVQVNLIIDVDGKEVTRTAWGGSKNADKADAIKGAWTQGLKRAAALVGIGKRAYEGTIDPEFAERSEDEAQVKASSGDDFLDEDVPRETPKPKEGKVISRDQVIRLKTIAGKCGGVERAKKIAEKFGYKSSTDIKVGDYDEIMSKIQEGYQDEPTEEEFL